MVREEGAPETVDEKIEAVHPEYQKFVGSLRIHGSYNDLSRETKMRIVKSYFKAKKESKL